MNGKWVGSPDDFDLVNPASGEIMGLAVDKSALVAGVVAENGLPGAGSAGGGDLYEVVSSML